MGPVSTQSLVSAPSSTSLFDWPEPIIPKPLGDVEIPGEPNIDYLKLILNSRVYDVASETPLTYANKLSERLDSQIYLKREDLQPIFSFKCRGSYNRIYQLSAEERQRGVCCVSAGNHAQGVALASKKLGIKATIVMPTFAPEIKVDSVKRLGAQVIQTGNDFDEAKKACLKLAKENNLTFIPPFDDPYVIAGQGSVAVEILKQVRQERLDAIFVCCGGGGLLAGIAAYVKRIRPEVKVIGVNTVDSDAMYKALHKGSPVELTETGLFSDGTSVRLVGNETFRLCRKYVDDFVLVTNDEICAAIKDAFEDTRSILEPAGALALAGLKRYLGNYPQLKKGVYVALTSGANMNFHQLRFVAERARIGEGREALMSILVPERPGGLKELYDLIYPRFLTEISYRYSSSNRAHVYVSFEVNSSTDVESIIEKLRERGFEGIDLSNNEMAKTHARYLAGGRSPNTGENEVLYRFRFPERPGAFKKFMNLLDPQWNISLFHYRNNGADFGRVLVGLRIAPDQMTKYKEFLEQLGKVGYYTVTDETENPAYKHFLR